jgi:transketolase
MRFLPTDPHNPSNDKFILSKGHAAPIYYAAWAESGNFPTSQLGDLRKVTSDLEGHPTPRLSFCDVATGSLGQGLGFTCGEAHSSKYFDKINNKYFCLMGDGECAEGSVWEAVSFASFYNLDNIVAIVDVNRLGQSAPTMLDHHTDMYYQRFKGFGWHTISVDGHNVEEIINAFAEARTVTGKPVAIIAQTFKGKYFGDIENKLNWHGKPITPKSTEVKDHIRSLMKNVDITLKTVDPDFTYSWSEDVSKSHYKLNLTYDKSSGKQVSTREAYGQALKKLGEQDKFNHVIALDCDVKNSTMSEYYEKAYPEKFINCYIAEQNMISVALGVSKRNKIPFCSTFGAFYSRAFDQIRMGAISFGNVKFFGSHSGTNIGQDGPSQMALEDLSMFRTVPNALVLYPSDAVSTERAVELAVNYNGLVYIKGGRSNHPILYENDEVFESGKGKVLKSSDKDVVTVVSAGATLFECLKMADEFAKEGVNVRVVDIFSIKPIDEELLKKCSEETNGLFFVVEDHYPEGGVGEAVIHALRKVRNSKVYHRAVFDIPRSGTPEELYDLFGLSAVKLHAELKGILAEN